MNFSLFLDSGGAGRVITADSHPHSGDHSGVSHSSDHCERDQLLLQSQITAPYSHRALGGEWLHICQVSSDVKTAQKTDATALCVYFTDYCRDTCFSFY